VERGLTRRAREVDRQVAAGVNRADPMQRKGFYLPPAAPRRTRMEVSGRIICSSPDVDPAALSVGDGVCADGRRLC
jgi:NADPH:quinone reductase-like Zn-dependent oxidoreductase